MLGFWLEVVLLLALRLAHQLVELSCLLAAWIQPAVALRHGEQAGQLSVIEPLIVFKCFPLDGLDLLAVFLVAHRRPITPQSKRLLAGPGAVQDQANPDPGVVIIGRDVIEC